MSDETKKPASGTFAKLMASPPTEKPVPERKFDRGKEETRAKPEKARERKKESLQAIKRASTQASKLASYPASTIEGVRRSVKTIGKEVAYVRLTEEEKQRLADVVYSYGRQKINTSETQVLRVALNFLLDDYKANGKASLLDRVIKALNA